MIMWFCQSVLFSEEGKITVYEYAERGERKKKKMLVLFQAEETESTSQLYTLLGAGE